MKRRIALGALAALALGAASCDKQDASKSSSTAQPEAVKAEAAKAGEADKTAAAAKADEAKAAEAKAAEAKAEAVKAEGAAAAQGEAAAEGGKAEGAAAGEVKAAEGAGAAGDAAAAGTGAPATPPGLEPPPDVAAVPADAERSASGLAWKVLKPGTGVNHPGPEDKVTVQYTGWTTDGKAFDSTIPRGQAMTLPLNGVVKGWTEGLQLMTAGEKRRFWIPGDLAYGDKPVHPGAPSGMLVFDIELEAFEPSPTVPVPEDVAAAPADAIRTASGLAYKVLQPGKGEQKPTATNTVKVHYTGWTTDGKRFDSSVVRGQPASFPLNRVIKGWTEGLQLMSVGEKTRFWIPADLAYGETPSRPGAPAGLLVFDVELLEILQ